MSEPQTIEVPFPAEPRIIAEWADGTCVRITHARVTLSEVDGAPRVTVSFVGAVPTVGEVEVVTHS